MLSKQLFAKQLAADPIGRAETVFIPVTTQKRTIPEIYMLDWIADYTVATRILGLKPLYFIGLACASTLSIALRETILPIHSFTFGNLSASNSSFSSIGEMRCCHGINAISA